MLCYLLLRLQNKLKYFIENISSTYSRLFALFCAGVDICVIFLSLYVSRYNVHVSCLVVICQTMYWPTIENMGQKCRNRKHQCSSKHFEVIDLTNCIAFSVHRRKIKSQNIDKYIFAIWKQSEREYIKKCWYL